MINSFSSRFIILGDINCHGLLWGANQEIERGNVKKMIDHHNLILLNDSVHTQFDIHHQTNFLLDLYVILRYTWMLNLKSIQID